MSYRPVFRPGGHRPTLVCSVSDKSEIDCVCTIRNALFDGADGFLFHLERMDPAVQNKDALKRIFTYTEDRPVLTVNYRTGGKTDDELAALQMEAVEAGAGCVDVMGDMFGRCELELTHDPEAVKRQGEYIARIHDAGAQVMMSSHILKYVETDYLLSHALEMERRGADIVKLVTGASGEEELIKGLDQTRLLKNTLHVPFLHIIGGQYGKVHRAIAPTLGSCMVLCVERYTPAGNKDKPLLRATRSLYDSLDWVRTRDKA